MLESGFTRLTLSEYIQKKTSLLNLSHGILGWPRIAVFAFKSSLMLSGAAMKAIVGQCENYIISKWVRIDGGWGGVGALLGPVGCY